MMRYVIVDLEAICSENVRSPDMETIDVGVVKLAGSGGPMAGEFGAFVRPWCSRA